MRRIEWSKDRFELRVVRVDGDVSWVEAQPLPPARLEPIWAFRADQHERAARRSRSLELKDCARIRLKASASYSQLSPTVHDRECIEEPGSYVGTRTSTHKDASQSGGRFYADELGRFGAKVYRQPAAARSHPENPPAVDLQLRENAGMNGLGLADGVPELRFQLINHWPEESLTEAV